MQKLREFDQNYGWIARWGLMILASWMLLFADSRYVRREEIQKYINQVQTIRSEDLQAIHTSIERTQRDYQTGNLDIRTLESRLSRLEAQNELIIRQLERLNTK